MIKYQTIFKSVSGDVVLSFPNYYIPENGQTVTSIDGQKFKYDDSRPEQVEVSIDALNNVIEKRTYTVEPKTISFGFPNYIDAVITFKPRLATPSFGFPQ